MNEVQPAKVGENAITICHNILRINSGSLFLSFFLYFSSPPLYLAGKALHILYGFITITIIGGDKIYRCSPSSQKGLFYMSSLLCTFSSPPVQTLPASTCANIYFISFTYLFAYTLSGCHPQPRKGPNLRPNDVVVVSSSFFFCCRTKKRTIY